MPKAVRQKRVTKTTLSKDGSVRSRIVPASSLSKGIKLLAYGRGKTGKTRLFSTFPKPALLLGTEDGTNSIADIDGIDFLYLQHSDDMVGVIEVLKEGEYQSVGLDTGGGFQEIIVKEALDLDEVPVQRTYGMGSGKFKDGRQMWGVVGLQFKERLRRLIDLADTQNINVMIIAHERNFQEEGDGHELITPTIGAALTPSVAGWLNGAVDYVCQTFIREQTNIVTQTIAGKKIKQKQKTGEMEYCLRIGPHPVYLTGFRVKKKVGDLPDSIVDPDYDKIMSLIEGS